MSSADESDSPPPVATGLEVDSFAVAEDVEGLADDDPTHLRFYDENSDEEEAMDAAEDNSEIKARSCGWSTQIAAGPANENDRLLYDDAADEVDAGFLDALRLVQSNGESSSTDAILACPFCFATVCIDCQRHSKHHNQFRAVFVVDEAIAIDHNDVLRPAFSGSDPSSGTTVYWNVRCTHCGTAVAVLEDFNGPNETYHFFNVLASDTAVDGPNRAPNTMPSVKTADKSGD